MALGLIAYTSYKAGQNNSLNRPAVESEEQIQKKEEEKLNGPSGSTNTKDKTFLMNLIQKYKVVLEQRDNEILELK